jgi:hypothetical protein
MTPRPSRRLRRGTEVAGEFPHERVRADTGEMRPRIGIGFTLQSGPLVFACMLMTGAAACAAVIEAGARERV